MSRLILSISIRSDIRSSAALQSEFSKDEMYDAYDIFFPFSMIAEVGNT